ncbi:FG-GAP and VCBS repeat-containing protein [Streptomyces sp. NBC_00566]|uniref:FG-GAP and VCBS repeat-containing protein n=1 Tax=Streptomyces sp. NBC_00566 TaxID=2975778 RepID=UPI002E8057D0|nr:FG-GAP and VCBS repeat-containing protein [Streptomyces sp. NBC_00566]WUB87723.1 FG-GAP and VCBS repeat-containing protein [Streptomyces sp. NBC_00566]
MNAGRRLAVLATATVVSLGAVVLGSGAPAGAASAAKAPATGKRTDFNGDGYADLAVTSRDAVTVLYGGKTGLSAGRNQLITPVKDLDDGSYWGFGNTMATGDLDGDGYDDLAVGAEPQGPSLAIVWGGPKGLSGRTSLIGSGDVSVVAGDFDGDGQNDLVVSASTGTELLRGPFGRDGSSVSSTRLDTGLATGGPRAAGDVNGDHVADLLLIGRDAGMRAEASLLLGSKNGFGAPKVIPTMVNSGTIADVDGDGHGDVVLGAGLAGYQPKGVVGGSVVVMYGGSGGLSATRKPVRISQDTPGVPGVGETYDRFGFDLDAGDMNGDGYADIAIGVMQENVSGVTATGTVTVLRGSPKGLTGTGSVSYNQNTPGVPGVNEKYDEFGWAPRLVDMNGDRRSELAVGTDGENGSEGNLWYFKSGSAGLTTKGVVSVGPRSVGLPTAKYRYFARYLVK